MDNNIFLYIVGWISLCNTYIINDIPKKRARNYVSFVHSLIWITSYNYFNFTIDTLYKLSTSYYIYDNWYMIYNKIKSDYPYIIHHIFSMIYLYEMYTIQSYKMSQWFSIGEVSNFFNYIVYDLIKLNYDSNIINNFKIIQLCWFSYFRVWYFSKIFYYNYNEIKMLESYYIILGLYSMGFIWTAGQIRKLIT